MNEPSTASILQRLPKVLAVTAASYGLPPADAARAKTSASNCSHGRNASARVQHTAKASRH